MNSNNNNNSFNASANAADGWRAKVEETRVSHGQASAAAGAGGLPDFGALAETLQVNK